MIAIGTSCGPQLLLSERAWRLAYLRTLHDLRRSVFLHRPISLPNLLRLYRRRTSGLCGAELERAGIEQLRRLYRQQQPFQDGWNAIPLA